MRPQSSRLLEALLLNESSVSYPSYLFIPQPILQYRNFLFDLPAKRFFRHPQEVIDLPLCFL
jgi:hypothetical protein